MKNLTLFFILIILFGCNSQTKKEFKSLSGDELKPYLIGTWVKEDPKEKGETVFKFDSSGMFSRVYGNTGKTESGKDLILWDFKGNLSSSENTLCINSVKYIMGVNTVHTGNDTSMKYHFISQDSLVIDKDTFIRKNDYKLRDKPYFLDEVKKLVSTNKSSTYDDQVYDEDSESFLVGKWTDLQIKKILTLNSDHTGTEYDYYKSYQPYTHNIVWEYDKISKSLNVTRSNGWSSTRYDVKNKNGSLQLVYESLNDMVQKIHFTKNTTYNNQYYSGNSYSEQTNFEGQISVFDYLEGKTFYNTSGNIQIKIGYSFDLGTYGITVNGQPNFFNLDITVLSKNKAIITGQSLTSGRGLTITVNSLTGCVSDQEAVYCLKN